MNYEQLQKLMNGEAVKVGEKNNKISSDGQYFLVEFFEFMEGDTEMFSTGPDFVNIEEAIKIAVNYTADSYTYMKYGRR